MPGRPSEHDHRGSQPHASGNWDRATFRCTRVIRPTTQNPARSRVVNPPPSARRFRPSPSPRGSVRYPSKRIKPTVNIAPVRPRRVAVARLIDGHQQRLTRYRAPGPRRVRGVRIPRTATRPGTHHRAARRRPAARGQRHPPAHPRQRGRQAPRDRSRRRPRPRPLRSRRALPGVPRDHSTHTPERGRRSGHPRAAADRRRQVTYRVRVQFTHDGPAVTGEWSVSDPPGQSRKSQRTSGRHGYGQHLRCHHANSGSAVGS